jgi:hypothetical protein
MEAARRRSPLAGDPAKDASEADASVEVQETRSTQPKYTKYSEIQDTQLTIDK